MENYIHFLIKLIILDTNARKSFEYFKDKSGRRVCLCDIVRLTIAWAKKHADPFAFGMNAK